MFSHELCHFYYLSQGMKILSNRLMYVVGSGSAYVTVWNWVEDQLVKDSYNTPCR